MKTQILIVDDDPAIRDSMKEAMEMAGYRPFLASCAEEALELLSKNMFHVVITDIMLPGLDGLELTDFIKDRYDSDVIVMTGYSGDYSYEEAITKGASDFVFKPVRFEELLLRLKRVLKERQLTKERNEMLETLQKLAITDGLTKLYNSRYFYNQLEREIDRSKRYNHSVALLLLDIDHFKLYNDTYGHLEGDKVLVKLGGIIKSCLRTMDSAYRYGGEEFTVILPETNGEEAIGVAERIRRTVETEKFSPEAEKGKAITITISAGVTEYYPNEDASTFIKRADKAMYTSKERGRNTVSSIFAEKSSQIPQSGQTGKQAAE
jgi:two-component system cell cycle response regulator